ncbi:copper amine oxidase N-terminal domain-containing protein [Paraclostridium bifermentans]|uniref:copper amine oxidase N-terminal domain-containing protein n=1 Tax=Paraclostridium bifermentans TaxID=1490 RepID=UPI002149C1B1|nr:copper amine oxidase N-terminal domain-containing protein [Paraclostridium bifermentans]MCR1876248.1 copper amine oxidase N-terminal domain-containing protein [Paraclostridium bifermentans]
MKNKKILALTTVLALSTTTLAFANEIKMVEKNGHDYVPFKTLVKKLGGEVEESKDELKANINSTQITIQTKSSFAKVDENYYPLEEKEINGYKIPIDTKPIYENKELYVSPAFLKSANLLNFDIEDGKLIINNKVEKETVSTVKEEPKKEILQISSEVKKEEPKKETQEKPQTTTKPSKPNKPNKPSNNHNNSNNNSNSNNNNNNSNNSNNTNNNNSSNNNTGSNNESSEDNNTENNNGSNTNGGNDISNNSQNNDSQTSPGE